MSARLLLADDHQIVRQGFRAILERDGYDIVGEASDGWTAVHLVRSLRPTAVVLDLSMPLLNGLDAARSILEEFPRLPVVLLTVHTEEHHIVAAMRAGVRAYILKTQAASELSDAMREVLAGGTFLSPSVSGTLVKAYVEGHIAEVDLLSVRERQVLQLVAEGKTTKEIATVLDLSTKTAEYYRSRLMQKLDIHHTAGLVRYAIRSGLVELGITWTLRLMHHGAPLTSLLHHHRLMM